MTETTELPPNVVIGQAVTFTDTAGVKHDALLTAVHGNVQRVQITTEFTGETRDIYPAVNLVYVSTDEAKRDPYGRQLERASSVSYGGGVGVTWGYNWTLK